MSEEPFVEIEPEEAAELIEQGRLRVVDVRHAYEYDREHIEGALLVPIEGLYDFARRLEEQALPREQPVLFVCAVGQRSAVAAEVAAIAGYRQVYNLTGGMGNWAYTGLPTVRK